MQEAPFNFKDYKNMSKPLLHAEIKRDIKQVYNKVKRAYLRNTNNKEEYAHLLRAYGITEELLMQILWEMNHKGKSEVQA